MSDGQMIYYDSFTDADPVNCHVCSKVFTSQRRLEKHIKHKHHNLTHAHGKEAAKTAEDDDDDDDDVQQERAVTKGSCRAYTLQC